MITRDALNANEVFVINVIAYYSPSFSDLWQSI